MYIYIDMVLWLSWSGTSAMVYAFIYIYSYVRTYVYIHMYMVLATTGLCDLFDGMIGAFICIYIFLLIHFCINVCIYIYPIVRNLSERSRAKSHIDYTQRNT